MKNNKLNFILGFVVIILLFLLVKTCNKGKRFESMAISTNDTLRISRNELGQQVATVSILQGSVADLKKLNSSKDSSLKHLQKLVDKHTISATVVSNVTGNTIRVITTVTQHDTIQGKDSLVYVYPKYATKYTNEWEFINIEATKDRFNIDYKVFNKFDIAIRDNRPKWYKARIPEITVTNLNPNTETLELKNFTIAPPKNQKLYVFLGGLIVGTISTGFVAYKLK